ncbi:MAG: hypothetical protein ABFR32_05660 [Bacteroidota bacterium]
MVDKKLPQEEEIDLGNLFAVIGKGISNLFKTILRLFNTLFHFFILFLIFLRNHAIKIGLAILIGAIVGFILDKTNEKIYVSNLIVETNYDSGAQLYKQINYLNNLVKREDTITLAKVLNISEKEAVQLKRISISPFQPERNLYKSYDEYMQNIDTNYTRGFTVDDYKKRLDKYDYKYQDIEAKAYSKTVFPNITPAIIVMVENDYYKNKRKSKIIEIKQKLFVLQKNLKQIDSLRNTYKEVALKEAENGSSTSTIEFAKNYTKNSENDIELFQTSNEILEEIYWTNKDLIDKRDVLNIISDFEDIGVSDKKILHKKIFQLAVLFGGMMLLWILLKQLNRYLKKYK